MTINKVGSKGIEDGSVATADLADNVVTSDKLGDGEVTNAKLANTTVTLAGQSITLGASGTLSNKFVDWQSVTTADGSTFNTAVSGQGYFIDTTSAAHTITLPASASIGDFIAIKDYAGTFATNNLTIARNGHNIQGVANDSLISTNRASLVLVYVDSTKGWLYWEEHNVGDLGNPLFTSATGGTITTSGDFKIHSFTGDGCFVVSTLGNSPTIPTGGPTNVDYLVVAGGGGGGMNSGGGGGAGGLRISSNFPITSTTYPITVGGGGAGRTANNWGHGSNGSDSIFSTITSSGGGGGGSNTTTPALPRSPNNAGAAGGSGGGHGAAVPGPSTKAAGNTPPVSPSQGSPGGSGSGNAAPNYAGGGGGGSGTAGSNSSPTNGGAGGAGTDITPIFGTAPQPFYIANGSNAGASTCGVFAGGGGGGVGASCQIFPGSPPSLGGSGGTGGGGNGVVPLVPGSGGSGVANTGGGGGGAGFTPGGYVSKPGGKGIVIIRYKFQ